MTDTPPARVDGPWSGSPRIALLAATLIPGVGPEIAVPAALSAPNHADSPPSLPPRQRALWRAAFADPAFADAVERELAALARLGAHFVTPLDPEWPDGLVPMGVLRVRGRIPRTSGLGVVGARRADATGREIATRVADAAVACGLPVISGGAYGVDIAAHRAALAAGGQTVVVLGAGLDHAGPRAHDAVFGAAAARGAVVSPFPCDRAPAAWTFPRRNPWIAGLSAGLVVVQAGLRSGSLQTARAALAQGRPVWSVPGPMDSPLHAGCLALLDEGARVLRHPAGWAETLGCTGSRRGEVETSEAGLAAPAEFEAIWRGFGAEAVGVDEVAARLALGAAEVAAAATLLEMGGWLRRATGGRFVRVIPGGRDGGGA